MTKVHRGLDHHSCSSVCHSFSRQKQLGSLKLDVGKFMEMTTPITRSRITPPKKKRRDFIDDLAYCRRSERAKTERRLLTLHGVADRRSNKP